MALTGPQLAALQAKLATAPYVNLGNVDALRKLNRDLAPNPPDRRAMSQREIRNIIHPDEFGHVDVSDDQRMVILLLASGEDINPRPNRLLAQEFGRVFPAGGFTMTNLAAARIEQRWTEAKAILDRQADLRDIREARA